MAQRWQKVGCWSILMLPFFAGAALPLAGAWGLASRGTGGGVLGGLALAAVGLGLVGFLGWFVRLRAWSGRGRPPVPEAVAPRPDRASPASGADEPSETVPRGRQGDTLVEVDRWSPGRLVVLRQRRSWSVGVLALALLAPVALFVVIPSLENQVLYGGEVRVGLPGTFFRVVGTWVWAGLVWVSLPSLPRRVTMDWTRDAATIEYGRRRRELGLSRAQAVELERTSGGVTDAETGHTRDVTHGHRIVLWIAPERGPAEPFLLVETDSTRSLDRADDQRRALAPVVEELAAALGVPTSRPPIAAGVEPHA